MENKKFLELAKKRFGDKIHIQSLRVKFKDARRLGFRRHEIARYPEQAWVAITEDKGYLCPVCGKALGGIFGHFRWSLAHGIGHCANCNKAEFRYYHYPVQGKGPIQLFALCGF